MGKSLVMAPELLVSVAWKLAVRGKNTSTAPEFVWNIECPNVSMLPCMLILPLFVLKSEAPRSETSVTRNDPESLVNVILP